MKTKKNQNAFNIVASVFLGDVRVIWCTLKVIVPIKQLWLCVGVIDLLILKFHLVYNECLDPCWGPKFHKKVHFIKSKERPWALTKENPIHEAKKDHEGPKSQKEGKRRNNNNNKEKRRGSRSSQKRILVRLKEGSWSGQRICNKKKDPSQTRGYA